SVPTCATAGVLGAAPAIIGSLEVSQALKLLLGGGKEFWGALTQLDVWTGEWLQINVEPDPECPACGLGRYEFLEAKQGSFVTSMCGRDAVQVSVRGDVTISLPRLAERLATSGQVSHNEYMLRCEIEGYELAVFPNGRAIIKGTTDETEARAVYARYVGL
ncbi:MAG: thiazole biosynthesis adenylyltransferase ThiF, partial [Delftia sp.]|nr:thiazole biosynthesis adenylyltransferase ThiF [Delftia sp.]